MADMFAHPDETVSYRAHVHVPHCYDDGDMFHDRWTTTEVYDFDATSEQDAKDHAQLQWVGEESCNSHPPKRHSWVVKLERVARCPERAEPL